MMSGDSFPDAYSPYWRIGFATKPVQPVWLLLPNRRRSLHGSIRENVYSGTRRSGAICPPGKLTGMNVFAASSQRSITHESTPIPRWGIAAKS
jgi:hypothetical protein